jgi:hypothetical protein
VQWLQSCFFVLPPPAANVAGPASRTAVMAKRNAFLILIELKEVKNKMS